MVTAVAGQEHRWLGTLLYRGGELAVDLKAAHHLATHPRAIGEVARTADRVHDVAHTADNAADAANTARTLSRADDLEETANAATKLTSPVNRIDDSADIVLNKGNEFFRKFKYGTNKTIRRIGRFTEFSVDVPGRVPGSFTRWVKTVDEQGRTIRLYHDTYDSAGRFIHRGIKLPGPERHVK